MENLKIKNPDLPLFWYISLIYVANAGGATRGLIDFKDEINKGIKHYQDRKSDLETCRNLKQFMDHKLAELTTSGYTGPYVEELTKKIENVITILQSGIELGEKTEGYHSNPNFLDYPWFRKDGNYDPSTLEGYLMLHYREFSVPTFTLDSFMKSGYFKHCLMHNWDARTSAETFCRLFNKAKAL